jgi:hypothetical protein
VLRALAIGDRSGQAAAVLQCKFDGAAEGKRFILRGSRGNQKQKKSAQKISHDAPMVK